MRNWFTHGMKRFYVIATTTFKYYIKERPSPSAVSGYHGRRRVRYRGQGDDLRIIQHEIEWIERFRKHDPYHFAPKLLDVSIEFGNAYYDTQYYPYPSFAMILRRNMNASFFVRLRWNLLLKGLSETLYSTRNSLDVPDKYLDEEVFGPLQQLLKEVVPDSAVGKVLFAPVLRVNSESMLGIVPLIERLMDFPEFRERLLPNSLHAVHGRMSLENILCGIRAQRMVLLHGGGCPKGIYGDVAKDIGRLYHELHGNLVHLQDRQYSLILMLVEQEPPEISFEMLNTRLRDRLVDNYVMVREAAETWVQPDHGNVLYRAGFYEAIEPLFDMQRKDMRRSEQLMLAVTAVLRLNQWMQQYHADLYEQLEVE